MFLFVLPILCLFAYDYLVPLDFKGCRCWTCVLRIPSHRCEVETPEWTCRPVNLQALIGCRGSCVQVLHDFACCLPKTCHFQLQAGLSLSFWRFFCFFQHPKSRSSHPVPVETRNKGQVLGLPLGQWSTPRGLRDLATYQTDHMKNTSFHNFTIRVHWKLIYLLWNSSFLKKTSFGFEWSIFR